MGRWGKCIARTVRGVDALDWVAAVTSQSADQLPLDEGVRRVSSVVELLSDFDLDGVLIASPASTHAEIICECLSRAIAVFVEKPACMGMAELHQIETAWEKHPNVFYVDYVNLFSGAYRVLKRRAHKSVIKEVSIYDTNLGLGHPDCPALWNYGTHDFAFLNDLLDCAAPQMSAAILRESSAGQEKRVTIEVKARFGDVKCSIITGNADGTKNRKLRIETESEQLVFDDLHTHKLKRFKNGHEDILDFDETLSLTAAITEWAESIQTGNRSRYYLNLTRRVTEQIVQCEAQLGQAYQSGWCSLAGTAVPADKGT